MQAFIKKFVEKGASPDLEADAIQCFTVNEADRRKIKGHERLFKYYGTGEDCVNLAKNFMEKHKLSDCIALHFHNMLHNCQARHVISKHKGNLYHAVKVAGKELKLDANLGPAVENAVQRALIERIWPGFASM